MKVLVLGAGGREHALAWKLSRERSVSDVLCAPGNPGTAACGINVAVDMLAPAAVVALAQASGVDLTIIGPEQPLAAGVADALRQAGAAVFGPSQAAARLETSKAFAKAFMERHGVPTAKARICHTPEQAEAAIGSFGVPVVVKADGLAAGKGVTVATTVEQARVAVDAAMRQEVFGDAGRTLLVEECLTGPEVSFFVLCDGRRGLPLASAQDHKRAFDNDQGPNTGGMGALAPSPLVDASLTATIMGTIVEPVLAGMAAEGTPFTGVLYCGLMLSPDGPRVIEFNVRFGDPEAQVILPLLDVELAPILLAAANGDLGNLALFPPSGARVGVVLASGGYPADMQVGYPIAGVPEATALTGVEVFQGGTRRAGDDLVTAGGRVLTVVGAGDTLAAARALAYEAVQRITFRDMHFRRDIAGAG